MAREIYDMYEPIQELVEQAGYRAQLVMFTGTATFRDNVTFVMDLPPAEANVDYFWVLVREKS